MPENFSKEDYNKLIDTLDIVTVFENKVGTVIDREAYIVLMQQEEENGELEILEGMAWRKHDEEHFEVKCEYIIRADNPSDRRKKLFEFEIEYCLVYSAGIQMTEKLFSRFRNTVRLNIWPYVREHVDDLSRRMKISELIIPPIRIEAEDVRPKK